MFLYQSEQKTDSNKTVVIYVDEVATGLVFKLYKDENCRDKGRTYK
jgi:hypothetical protein